MIYTQTKQPDNIHQQTSKKETSGSPFSGDINNFSTKLTSLLPENKQNELQEKNEKMKDLLKQLKEAVKARSDEVNYDYDENDYIQRLCQDYDIIEKTLNEKVLTGSIKVIYDEIITFIGDDKNGYTFTKKLFIKFFNDLVYESIETSDIKDNEKEIYGIEDLKSYAKIIKDYKSKGVNYLKFIVDRNFIIGNKFNKRDIIKLVKKSGDLQMKGLNFYHHNLGDSLGEEGILELYKTIGKCGIKYSDFGYNNFGIYLDINYIYKIIKIHGKYNMKYLNFGASIHSLKLEDNEIVKIFELAGKNRLKYIVLSGNNINLSYSLITNLIDIAKEYKLNVNIENNEGKYNLNEVNKYLKDVKIKFLIN